MTTTTDSATMLPNPNTETVAERGARVREEHLRVWDQRQADELVAQRKRAEEAYRQAASASAGGRQSSGSPGLGMLLLMLILIGGGAALCSVSLWLGFPLFMLGVGVLTMLER